jgi:hypothetical protein
VEIVAETRGGDLNSVVGVRFARGGETGKEA